MDIITTGWPPSELMQDDCRKLSKWLSTRIDSRLHAREAAEAIQREREQDEYDEVLGG